MDDELDEDEVYFFNCADCQCRKLAVHQTIEIVTTFEYILPCRCGNSDDAARRTEQLTRQDSRVGFVTNDRHFVVEETEDQDELDRSTDDEVYCDACYSKFGGNGEHWEFENMESVDGESDLLITCHGCEREIEFGYSHANQQGRIFLGEDDADFSPWLTFPDPKYIANWSRRGWLRPL